MARLSKPDAIRKGFEIEGNVKAFSIRKKLQARI